MSGPRLLRDQRGATAIEFAMVAPIVILLIMTALQFGMALRANAGLRDLAGWAGREAVVSYQITSDNSVLGAEQLETNITARAQNARYNLTQGELLVDVSNTPDTTLLTVNRVRIVLTYSYPISMPFLPAASIPLSVDRTFYVPNGSTL